MLERTGMIPGSDSVNQTFSIDWSTAEKSQLDFINYYQLEISYDDGTMFRSFNGRIGYIK